MRIIISTGRLFHVKRISVVHVQPYIFVLPGARGSRPSWGASYMMFTYRHPAIKRMSVALNEKTQNVLPVRVYVCQSHCSVHAVISQLIRIDCQHDATGFLDWMVKIKQSSEAYRTVLTIAHGRVWYSVHAKIKNSTVPPSRWMGIETRHATIVAVVNEGRVWVLR